MEKLNLIKNSEEKLVLYEKEYYDARRNFKIAIRDKQENTKEIGDKFYSARDKLKLIRRKLLYLKNPEILYVDEFFSKRHKGMKGWEIKLGKSLSELFYITSMVDFGCGLGAYLEGSLLGETKKVLGFDLMYDKAKPYISDVMQPFVKYGNAGEKIDCGKWDCALSVETAEHLAEEEADIFIDNLTKASSRIIVLTASNAGGRYHINRQQKSYWIDKLKVKNWIYNQKAVDSLYKIWQYNGSPGYILNNLMVFFYV
jgi:hypothetical protein